MQNSWLSQWYVWKPRTCSQGPCYQMDSGGWLGKIRVRQMSYLHQKSYSRQHDKQNKMHGMGIWHNCLQRHIYKEGKRAFLFLLVNILLTNHVGYVIRILAWIKPVWRRLFWIFVYISQLNLVCDDAIKIPNAQMIFFSGVLSGSLVYGQISDLWVSLFFI